MEKVLVNRQAIITGGNQGLGLEIALNMGLGCLVVFIMVYMYNQLVNKYDILEKKEKVLEKYGFL